MLIFGYISDRATFSSFGSVGNQRLGQTCPSRALEIAETRPSGRMFLLA